MNGNPTVSIIIPAYKAAGYIAETIQAVIDQTFTGWELIIIDDGSPDKQAEVIMPFLADKRISYYYQENAGVSAARNHGMQYAKGRYLSLLDADDVWRENNLEVKISYLESHPEIDFVYSDIMLAIEDVNHLESALPASDTARVQDILLWEGEVIPVPCSNVVYRIECYRDGVKFDPALSTAADQDFTIQMTARYNSARIAEKLVLYRVRKDSMSRNIQLMERDHLEVFRKAERNGLFPSGSFRRKCFSNLYMILAGSWWVNANNRTRGMYFILRSLLAYPPNVSKLLKKFAR
jgi:glycosyltransferase involved in cell wall biosynthesis